MKRRLRYLLGVLLLVICLSPIQLSAHTALVEMSPKSASQLEQSPEHVLLRFSQKLEAVSDRSFGVEDESGKSIELGEVEIGDNGKSVQIALPALAKGTYTVRYQVMSTDGHLVKGSYNFAVLNDPEMEPEPDPVIPDTTPVIPEPEPNLEPEATDSMEEDYGVAPIDDAPSVESRWSDTLTGITVIDVLRMLYMTVFLLLVGMIVWDVQLQRGRSVEDGRRPRAWILLLQRLHLLILIVVVVEFVRSAVGLESWQPVKDILLHTTSGISWTIILVLSFIGLAVLRRSRITDVIWVLIVIASMTQIGHAASTQYRLFASVLSGIHMLAAAVWAGGLLYLLILLKGYSHTVGQSIRKFSNASLIAISLIIISGMVSSIQYLNDLSYVFQTRWGHLLLLKIAVVILVIMVGTIIRSRYIRKGQFQIGTWIKLDIILLIIIASLAALLSSVEPNPPNEPLHWHEMGEDIHMTAKITPRIPGDNQFELSVWLPEHSGEPTSVSMSLTLESEDTPKNIELTELDRDASEYGFGGFNEYMYEADSDELDRAGIWLIRIVVTNQDNQSWTYEKEVRVY
jgi:copper transport protein